LAIDHIDYSSEELPAIVNLRRVSWYFPMNVSAKETDIDHGSARN
jgi:hypothetical protein